jgi:Na+/glutamate symporter
MYVDDELTTLFDLALVLSASLVGGWGTKARWSIMFRKDI